MNPLDLAHDSLIARLTGSTGSAAGEVMGAWLQGNIGDQGDKLIDLIVSLVEWPQGLPEETLMDHKELLGWSRHWRSIGSVQGAVMPTEPTTAQPYAMAG